MHNQSLKWEFVGSNSSKKSKEKKKFLTETHWKSRKIKTSVSHVTREWACWVFNVSVVTFTATAIDFHKTTIVNSTIRSKPERDFRLNWLKSIIRKFRKSDKEEIESLFLEIQSLEYILIDVKFLYFSCLFFQIFR